jgi:hypothetical protein
MKRMMLFLLRCRHCGTRFQTWAMAMTRDEREGVECSGCSETRSKRRS